MFIAIASFDALNLFDDFCSYLSRSTRANLILWIMTFLKRSKVAFISTCPCIIRSIKTDYLVRQANNGKVKARANPLRQPQLQFVQKPLPNLALRLQSRCSLPDSR